ncbi:MAG: hypothetical protein ACT4P4_16075 [Betaproteobacteria bacterium]
MALRKEEAMMKRSLIVLLLAGAAASAYAATHLERIACALERTSGVAQEVASSKPVQLANHLEVAPPRAAEDLDDERGRYYDERDLPFPPQRW